MVKVFEKSRKLRDVCYDIRGPILEEAYRLEEEGYRILKLNIGNPAPFGFETPDEIIHDVIHNLPQAQGYAPAKGIYSARKAVMQYAQQLGINGVNIEHVFIGNGVSELIGMAMQALLNDDDEMLIPAPDYPLWTAAVTLTGATPRHYICDEGSNWYPDIEDMRAKVTPRTRGIVLINPNNPTGAVYPRDVLEAIVDLAREHDLIIFSDEIYDKIIYDNGVHTPIASLADDLLFITLNGLSKVYRAAGFRCGWMIVSGATTRAPGYIEGLEMLSSMRLCANVIAQYAVQTALGGYQSIEALVAPDGRLTRQRDISHELLCAIPGVSCVKPAGALYMFPHLDRKRFSITDDERMVLDLLRQEHILIVQGTAFNWPEPDHFRLVFLPDPDELNAGIGKIAHFLDSYSQ